MSISLLVFLLTCHVIVWQLLLLLVPPESEQQSIKAALVLIERCKVTARDSVVLANLEKFKNSLEPKIQVGREQFTNEELMGVFRVRASRREEGSFASTMDVARSNLIDEMHSFYSVCVSTLIPVPPRRHILQ